MATWLLPRIPSISVSRGGTSSQGTSSSRVDFLRATGNQLQAGVECANPSAGEMRNGARPPLTAIDKMAPSLGGTDIPPRVP